jgi:hypothetical protein
MTDGPYSSQWKNARTPSCFVSGLDASNVGIDRILAPGERLNAKNSLSTSTRRISEMLD